MDGQRFDALTRVFGRTPSRRALMPLLGSVLSVPFAASWRGMAPAAAKKKKKKKKATLCLDGQTIQASKKKKKKLLKSGATPGECPPGCAPNCPGTICGSDDGCGGTCACAAGSLCQGGVCHVCTLNCTGDGAACGANLKTELAGGGLIYACPGRYVGSFEIAKDVTLIGAGEGDDPAKDTILDAGGAGRVLNVKDGVTALLHGLRMTGGIINGAGGGILNDGELTLTACTIDRNVSNGAGGIYQQSTTGLLTLNNCTVSRNKANNGGHGGGIFVISGAEITIHGSAITDNEATDGGGISTGGTATLDSACSVTGNTATAGSAGGIDNSGTVTLNGATVTGNIPNNCAPTAC